MDIHSHHTELQRNARHLASSPIHSHPLTRESDSEADTFFMNLSGGHLVLLLMDFVLNNTSFLGSSRTTNQSSISVKVSCDFLEGGVLGLDVVEVDKDEFGGEPDTLEWTLEPYVI